MSSMSPAAQLLSKYSEDICEGRCLIVDPIQAEAMPSSDWPNTEFLVFRDLNIDSHFSTHIWPEQPQGTFDSIVLFYPKSKDKLPWLLHQISQLVHDDTVLYFVGDNKGGIKSGLKKASDYLSQINKIASGKHCLLFSAQLTDFEKQNIQDSFEQYQFELPQQSIDIASLPGVFSHGRLDQGTALLLENLPPKVSGDILDFACGCGIIGSYLAKTNKLSKLDLIDIDSLAVESTKQTLELNGVQGNTWVSDGLTKISSKYDWIFTNPPFHTGLQIDYHISAELFKHCKRHLKNHGKLVLVANSFLKYPQILQKHFDLIEVIAEDSKFKVYCCS